VDKTGDPSLSTPLLNRAQVYIGQMWAKLLLKVKALKH
jgi:hypothetical protein